MVTLVKLGRGSTELMHLCDKFVIGYIYVLN